MKKIFSAAAFVFMVTCSFAQVQRKTSKTINSDSTVTGVDKKKGGGMDKKQMMRELDLTREQRIKFKELRQSMQAKKEAIENDDKLSGPEKESQLKELRKEQAKNTMAILTPEQKVKMLKMRKEKKGGEMGEMDNE